MSDLKLFTELATGLILIATVSFMFKSEAIRGGGRVVLGFGLGFVGAAVFKAVSLVNSALLGGALHLGGLTVKFDIPDVGTYQWCGWIFVACGALTAIFGARKFLRRNSGA
jgi:hypothetical protein